MARILAFAAFIAACFTLSPASAEIGAVGSPHDAPPAKPLAQNPAAEAPDANAMPDDTAQPMPSRKPNPAAAQPGTEVASGQPATNAPAGGEGEQEEEEPLLEVNFTRPTVYFDRALAKGVEAAEAAKPGVMYEVVSYLPPSGSTRQQNERMNQQATGEVQSVINQLRAQGIQESRIRVTTHVYEAEEKPPENHRVSVFVK